MNTDVKVKWKAALTSGEYEKGVGNLRTSTNKFCCLGVLCDIYIKETGNGRWIDSDLGYVFVDSKEHSSGGFPTNEVVEWAGLDGEIPYVFNDNGDEEHLHYLNDEGMSFVEIAKKIDTL